MNASLRSILSLGSLVVALAMLGYSAFLIRKNTPKPSIVPVRFNPPTHPSVQISSPSHSPHRDAGWVSGVGIIEPAGEAIAIGSQISGIVSKVLVAPGDHVEEGTPLLVLDDRTARANVEVARANLKAQKAKWNELRGQIEPQRSRVEAALALLRQNEASLNYTQQELQRGESLTQKKAISEEELGQRRMNVDIAKARVAEAEAKHREALGNLRQLDGDDGAPTIEVQAVAVEQANAALLRDEVALSLHTIVAPKSSSVLQVKVRAGEFLPASILSSPPITLGVIDPLHVRVDIDEADIPRFHPSAKARASVRGRPEVRVPLAFIRTEPYVIPKRMLNGSVSERVDTRVLQLIYSVSPTEIQAVAGQQVDVYIEEMTKAPQESNLH